MKLVTIGCHCGATEAVLAPAGPAVAPDVGVVMVGTGIGGVVGTAGKVGVEVAGGCGGNCGAGGCGC